MGPLDSIRGYAVIWDVVSDANDWLRDGDISRMVIARGAASWGDCSFNYGHAENTACAHVRDGTLRLWKDDQGVAFEADIPCTVEGAGYRAMMASGGPWGASPLFQIYGREVEGEGADRIETVRCRLLHVAVTPTPAFPQTAAWLASQAPASLPEHARALARWWRLGELSPVARQAAPSNLKPEPVLIDGIEPHIWAQARGIDTKNFGFLPELMLKLRGA